MYLSSHEPIGALLLSHWQHFTNIKLNFVLSALSRMNLWHIYNIASSIREGAVSNKPFQNQKETLKTEKEKRAFHSQTTQGVILYRWCTWTWTRGSSSAVTFLWKKTLVTGLTVSIKRLREETWKHLCTRWSTISSFSKIILRFNQFAQQSTGLNCLWTVFY